MSKKFQKAAERTLKALGFTYSEDEGFYPWYIDTKAGPLQVAIMDDWLACVFADVQAAKSILGSDMRLNVHSGKWNWMGGESDLHWFSNEVKQILA